MRARFTIHRSIVTDRFYYRLESAEKQIILSGEGYPSKQSCITGIYTVKENANLDNHYERRDGAINYTFNLKAPNGEILGRSENYHSKAARENAIATVKEQALMAIIE